MVRRHYYFNATGKLKESLGRGCCYMHVDNETPFSNVDGDSYCPDYYNRKRGDKEQKMTLQQWIENLPK